MLYRTLIFGLLALLIAGCSAPSEEDTPARMLRADETLMWVEEFKTLNKAYWNVETRPVGWEDSQLQSYSPARVRVGKDGDKSVLIISAIRRSGRISSGRINTLGHIHFRSGTIKASIRMPRTEAGLVPIFRLVGDSGETWPECGEIDIVKMGGAQGMLEGVAERYIYSGIHYSAGIRRHMEKFEAHAVPQDIQDGKYHTFTLEKSEQRIAVSVDGREFAEFNVTGNESFSRTFCIVLELAAGGDFANIHDMRSISAIQDGGEAVMMVDWIKVCK